LSVSTIKRVVTLSTAIAISFDITAWIYLLMFISLWISCYTAPVEINVLRYFKNYNMCEDGKISV